MTCSICNDIGWLRQDVPFGSPQFGQLVPCICMQRVRAEQRQQKQMRQLETLHRTLGALANCSFDSFNPTRRVRAFTWQGTFIDEHTQRDALKYALATCRSFAHNMLETPWLYVYGAVGSGKSHLAAATLNALTQQERHGVYTSMLTLLQHLRRGIKDSSVDERLQTLQEVDVLCIDDMGTETATDWVQEQLYLLLNDRYVHQRITIITTNVRLAAFDERIADRIRERATEILLPVSSYRQLNEAEK